MDGVSDASSSLERDVVQKHGSPVFGLLRGRKQTSEPSSKLKDPAAQSVPDRARLGEQSCNRVQQPSHTRFYKTRLHLALKIKKLIPTALLFNVCIRSTENTIVSLALHDNFYQLKYPSPSRLAKRPVATQFYQFRVQKRARRLNIRLILLCYAD